MKRRIRRGQISRDILQSRDASDKIDFHRVLSDIWEFFRFVQSFQEILRPNFQACCHIELCLTYADSQNDRYNSKRTPQFETTNYLAK